MRKATMACVVVMVGIVEVLPLALSQEALTMALEPSGRVLIRDVEGDVGVLELNLHNSNWKYASQAEATAKCEEQAGGGKVFTGELTVPDVPGAAISFIETITKNDDGVHIIYELKPGAPVILNGLQISLLLPSKRFSGQQLLIRGNQMPERTITLPATLDPDRWQLGTVQGKVVQVGADQATALTLGIDKVYGIILHDLRQWDRDEFEIRIPLVQEDQGKMIGLNDRYDVEVVIGPPNLEVTGP